MAFSRADDGDKPAASAYVSWRRETQESPCCYADINASAPPRVVLKNAGT